VQEAVDDIVGAPEWAAPMNPRTWQAWRGPALFVGYVALYLALDRLSFIEALHGIGITPWNPSTGLMLALLIIKGPRWSSIVLTAELLSGATLPVVSIPPLPYSWARSWWQAAMQARPQFCASWASQPVFIGVTMSSCSSW